MQRMIVPGANLWAMEPGRFSSMLVALKAACVAGVVVEVKAQSGNVPRRTIGSVEIVEVRGVLDRNPSWMLELMDGTSYQAIAAQVRAAAADPEVGSILMVIDSPGGSVDGLADAADVIFEARKSKPVIAQVQGMAASAAYYLASQANKINAGRMDMIGSIGTILPMYDRSEFYKKAGVENISFTTGPYKGAGMEGKPVTEEQRAYFQGIVDSASKDFVAAIRRGRSIEGLKDVADGRVFFAPDAKAAGLIDAIKTLDETLSGLAKAKGTPRRARASLDILLAEENGGTPSRTSGDSAARSGPVASANP